MSGQKEGKRKGQHLIHTSLLMIMKVPFSPDILGLVQLPALLPTLPAQNSHNPLFFLSFKELVNFPGSLAVKTLCCQCRGERVLSLVRELRSHMPYGAVKN